MTSVRSRFLGFVFAALLALATAIAAPPARADDAAPANPSPPTRADDAAPASPSPPTQQQAIDAEKADAEAAVDKAKVLGPAQVTLQDQGVLALPEGFSFVPQPQAGRLMRAYGNSDSSALVGLILPEAADGNWWATLDFVKAGYVKDDDAKNWNADELLASLKEATESQNAERGRRGFPAVEITGWIEPPAYDASSHRLVWSALVRQIGGNGDQGSVNYNTYALGREGYFSLDLITSQAAIAANKSVAQALLADISYDKGKAYQDFEASSDHVAAYGLAALIGGVALHKFGLFALGAAFVLKFAKVLGLGAVVVVAALRRLFVRAKKKAPE
jgi:uncharacterized membrane-anchored protein